MSVPELAGTAMSVESVMFTGSTVVYKLYEKYRGLWVALSEDDNETVVGSGATAKEDSTKRNTKGSPYASGEGRLLSGGLLGVIAQ